MTTFTDSNVAELQEEARGIAAKVKERYSLPRLVRVSNELPSGEAQAIKAMRHAGIDDDARALAAARVWSLASYWTGAQIAAMSLEELRDALTGSRGSHLQSAASGKVGDLLEAEFGEAWFDAFMAAMPEVADHDEANAIWFSRLHAASFALVHA